MLVRSSPKFKCGCQTKCLPNLDCCNLEFLGWQGTAVLFHVYVWVIWLSLTVYQMSLWCLQSLEVGISYPQHTGVKAVCPPSGWDGDSDIHSTQMKCEKKKKSWHQIPWRCPNRWLSCGCWEFWVLWKVSQFYLSETQENSLEDSGCYSLTLQ